MRTEPSFSEESDNPLDNIDQSASALSSRFDVDSSMAADYRQRYGLSMDPFIDDPHFPFYQGAQRRQVLEQLIHLCQFSHNLLVVTGEFGVGKTRMAQALIDGLDDADDISFVEGQINSDFNSVLADVLDQFELEDLEGFTRFCQKNSDADGLVVLIVDNAHHLTDEVIVGLIQLLQDNPESRLHLVLFSEPYLVDRLESINAPGVVLTDFSLEKFSLTEAVDYLNFRMEMADYLGPEVFVEARVEPWWRQSQGQLLHLHEYAQQKLLESVSRSQQHSTARLYHKRGLPIPHIVAASALVGGLFFWFLYQGRDGEKAEESKVSLAVPVHPQSNDTLSSFAAKSQVSSVSEVGAAMPANKEAVSSISSSSVSALAEAERVQPTVKQSVVPLVQTSELQNESARLSVKSSASSNLKAEIKTSIASAVVKSSIKSAVDASVSASVKQSANYSDQEKTILGWSGSEYTLQLMGLSNEKAAVDFIAAQPNRRDLLLFKTKRAGKDWFVVVTGHYASSVQARQAAKGLGEAQTKAAPWPREIKIIQDEIRQR